MRGCTILILRTNVVRWSEYHTLVVDKRTWEQQLVDPCATRGRMHEHNSLLPMHMNGLHSVHARKKRRHTESDSRDRSHNSISVVKFEIGLPTFISPAWVRDFGRCAVVQPVFGFMLLLHAACTGTEMSTGNVFAGVLSTILEPFSTEGFSRKIPLRQK